MLILFWKPSTTQKSDDKKWLKNNFLVVFNDGLVFTNSHKHTQATYIYMADKI